MISEINQTRSTVEFNYFIYPYYGPIGAYQVAYAILVNT